MFYQFYHREDTKKMSEGKRQTNDDFNETSCEEFYGQTTTFALGFLLAQILFFGALVAACCGGFGGFGGSGSDAPAADAGLPLYTLGGKFG